MIYMVIDLWGAAICALPLAWIFMAFCKNGSIKRFCLMGLFTLYLCEMFNVVGIPGVKYFTWAPTVNLIPFSDEINRRFLFQISMNAVMLLPFGFFLPVLWKKCRSWKVTTLAGFVTSAMIEFIQMFSFRTTDVDDLLMNTLGAFLGYLLAWACFHNRWKRPDEEKPSRVGDLTSLTVSVLIPLLSIVLVRWWFCEWVYSLPVW